MGEGERGGGGSLGCRSAQQTVPVAAISDRQAVWVTLPAEAGWGLGHGEIQTMDKRTAARLGSLTLVFLCIQLSILSPIPSVCGLPQSARFIFDLHSVVREKKPTKKKVLLSK